MISMIMILNQKGDIMISRQYRQVKQILDALKKSLEENRMQSQSMHPMMID